MSVVDEANKPASSEAPSGSTLTLIVSNGPDQRAGAGRAREPEQGRGLQRAQGVAASIRS